MMIIPPKELVKYISVDENGVWIHDPNMPEELKEKFEEFVQQIDEAKEFGDREFDIK